MIVTLPDRQLLEALTPHTSADRLDVELRIWGWNSPVHDVLDDEADDVVATVLPYFRPASAWRSLVDLPKLRLLQVQLAGYDSLLHITPDGVVLANARGVHKASILEPAVGLMLATQWELSRWARECCRQAVSTRALADSRMPVIGAGAIGEAIRSRLAPFEAEIMWVTTTARDDEHGHTHGIDELPELFPNTDILVLIVPLAGSTRGLTSVKELTLLSDGALVANATCGPVVDTDTITAEVVAGRLRMAPDVFDPEPLPDDHPLWQVDGALISPHIGGNTTAMLSRIIALLADQLSCLADGRGLKFAVKS